MMSVREITQQIAQLKPNEQDEVAAFLSALQDERSMSAREALDAAHREIGAGKAQTLDELRRRVGDKR